jgi:hypothetical protein
VLAATVFSPSAISAQETPTDKITFTMGTLEGLIPPNPFKAAGGSEHAVLFLAYDMLSNFSQTTMEPTSGLASFPPERSANGKT